MTAKERQKRDPGKGCVCVCVCVCVSVSMCAVHGCAVVVIISSIFPPCSLQSSPLW